jgi:hypothetical protein
MNLATDKSGKGVAFYNITGDGHGCQGRYQESGKLYRGNVCFVRGVKCYAEEAYMGGIVIRPSSRTKARSVADGGTSDLED